MNTQQHNKGIALFISVIVISALLLISFSIADIAYKQQVISFAGRESRGAFYAADTGLECVLYHDLKVADFFPTYSLAGSPTIGNLSCDGQTFTARTDPTTAADAFHYSTTTSHLCLASNCASANYGVDITNGVTGAKNCFKVDISKVQNSSTLDISTYVTSRGYNTACATLSGDSLRSVERALEIRY